MQTFKVGDKAVYPGQGVGEVMGIEHKDIAGQRQSFYVLKIMENGMKILIPINKVGSVGLRSLIDEKAVVKVYTIGPPPALPGLALAGVKDLEMYERKE